MYATSNILDTLRLDETGFFLKDLHIDRTFAAFQKIGSNLTRDYFVNSYSQVEQQLLQNFSEKKLVRLIFDRTTGQLYSEAITLNKIKSPVVLQIVSTDLKPDNEITNFKWEDRNFWFELLSKKSSTAEDILILNADGFICEASRFNFFIYNKKDDCVYTPPLSSGCLSGVYRRYALQNKVVTLPNIGTKNIFEKDLTLADLDYNVAFVVNSVREILPAFIEGVNGT